MHTPEKMIRNHCTFAVLQIHLSQVLPRNAATSTGNTGNSASAALSPRAVIEAMNAKAWLWQPSKLLRK